MFTWMETLKTYGGFQGKGWGMGIPGDGDSRGWGNLGFTFLCTPLLIAFVHHPLSHSLSHSKHSLRELMAISRPTRPLAQLYWSLNLLWTARRHDPPPSPSTAVIAATADPALADTETAAIADTGVEPVADGDASNAAGTAEGDGGHGEASTVALRAMGGSNCGAEDGAGVGS